MLRATYGNFPRIHGRRFAPSIGDPRAGP